MSAEYAGSEVRTVLRCLRAMLGADAAFFLPLGPGPAPVSDGPTPVPLDQLLPPPDRARLRAGELLLEPNSHGPRIPRIVVPVDALGGAALGALGVLGADGADPAQVAQVRELGGLLGHALAAAASQAEEGEYSRFFTLILDNLCIAGFDGYFKLLNPSWEHTLGYTLEELYARPYLEFVHPEDREITTAEKDWLSGGGQTITFSNRYIRKDGSLCYLQWTAAPSSERKRVYAVARDVTEQMRVALELRKSREAAEAASQAKSAFLAMMSHELRTPLNSVIGFSSLLLKNKHGALSAEELDYLGRIQSNGRDLLELINSILDLSRIEAGRVEPDLADFDLGELARDTLASLRPQTRAGVELVLEAPEGPLPVHSDEGRLRQILINLLGNGLKFTERGRVTLRVLCDGRTPTALEVEDTGPGIPAEDLEAIFEPFRQLEEGAARHHGGTGLGLAISRSFANALGLTLGVRSEVGQGTCFRIGLQPER